MNDKIVLMPSARKFGKAMENARQLAELSRRLGGVIIEVRPVAEIEELRQKVATLAKALRSIGANTCCDRCQEAALVARAALKAAGLDK